MANYYKRSGGSKAGTIYATVVTLLLIAAIILGVCAFTIPWVEPVDKSQTEQTEQTGGAIVGEGEGSGISLMSAKLTADEYEDYGVSTLADTAYTVTVVPNVAGTVDTYEWTCTNTTQISLDVSEDTKSCVVSCSGAFSTQATLTVTSELNSNVTAQCVIDYVKRLSSVSVSLSPSTVEFNSTAASYTVTATPVWGVGTITPTLTVTGGSISHNFDDLGSVTVYNMVNTRTGTFTTSKTFEGNSISISTPYALFFVSSTTNQENRFVPVPDISQLISEYNNLFTEQTTGTTSDGTLTVNYTVSYTPEGDNSVGSYSTSGTASANIAFDTSDILVTASSANTNWDRVVF